MKTENRFLRKVFISLLVVCTGFILLLSFPASSRQEKSLRLRWTGKMSLNVQTHPFYVHGDAEPFETVTRYNIGPIQLNAHKRKRD